MSGSDIPFKDKVLCDEIMNTYNNSLRFDPSKPLMAYTIKDAVKNGRAVFLWLIDNNISSTLLT